MRYSSAEFEVDTWATKAHFRSKTTQKDVVTDCALPNEKRYAKCAAERLLGIHRKLEYREDERIVIVNGMGAAEKMAQIRAICASCIKNRENDQTR